jgi:hypothetical protein
LICHYCQCSGEPWTDALEDALTLPRLYARMDYWREFPPAHLLMRDIAVGLGVFEPPKRKVGAAEQKRLAEKADRLFDELAALRKAREAALTPSRSG